ncbi:MAG: OmpA family protein [Dyadobacter sp.]|uniref:OmpA family protein n=1 Tax=Dyadobacter sp. TaxID=1914288 RepID=UPI0032646995
MPNAWGQCFTFNGIVFNAVDNKPISASFSVRTESRKLAIGKSNEKGTFSLQAPCDITTLVVEKQGFRTVSMPVTGKDGKYFFELSLFPVDKQTNDRPYFQSEQKDLVLNNSDSSKIDKKVTRLFKLVDVQTRENIEGEICLYYTKSGAKNCFVSGTKTQSKESKITFTHEDIIGLVATVNGYQPYNGNLIIDRIDNSSSIYEIAMSKVTSILAFSIDPIDINYKYKTEILEEQGKKLTAKMLDMSHGFATIKPGAQHKITVTSNIRNSKPFSSTLPSTNGLLLVKLVLPEHQTATQTLITPPARPQSPGIEPTTFVASIGRTIYFDQSSYELRQESKQTLDSLAIWLLQNPESKIEIIGHTDNIGDRTRNMTLSEYRSKVTTNYLVSHGASKNQLQWKARGGEQPEFSNDEEKTKALNRRVELRILK